MKEIKFGTDGWRAVIGQEYTTENVARVSVAVADWLIENYQEPYTMMLVVFSIISVISIPCYFLAGKRYKKDKVLLDEVFSEARS